MRCFLHYQQGRDLNGLTYEMQSEAASKGIGLHGGHAASPNDWMRVYFRHARAIYRLTVLFDEVPRAKSVWSRLLGYPQVAAIDRGIYGCGWAYFPVPSRFR